MAVNIKFELQQYLAADADSVYADLCDWKNHGRWVPLTRIVMHSNQEFTAYTGVRPFVLADRMRVTGQDDDARTVTLEKLGPLLKGTAGFGVRRYDDKSCIVTWREDIKAQFFPKFLSKPLTATARILFRYALRRLS